MLDLLFIEQPTVAVPLFQMARWSKSDLAGTCLVPAPIRAAIPKRRPDAIRLLTTSREEGFRSVAIAADGQSGIIWNHWKVTTQSCHAIHIRLQCPEDSILKANLVKLVNARYKQRV
jgi:hypothetical protein